MSLITIALFYSSLGVVTLLLLIFTVYAYKEKEQRAFIRGLMSFLLFSAILAIPLYIAPQPAPWLLVVPAMGLLLVLPKYGNSKIDFSLPAHRFDERDVMFSRNTLKEGSDRFEAYYKMRPEKKELDDAFRAEAGLLSGNASLYNELLFNAAQATFQTVELLQPLTEKEPQKMQTTLPADKIASFVKNWTIKLGAVDVGFTVLKPHHIYTNIGRGEAYGKKVTLNHRYAIAFTVEMSHESLAYNPRGPVVMESAQQYLSAGQIAIQVAQFLRNLGIDARAHIDANYRLICPVVAMDAGLGVIGRMGLLMTPKLGPRVRIGVVSTNLELPVKESTPDYSAIHFCNICKKCSDNCPSRSIPEHSIKGQNKPGRWTINHEKCFTFWCKTGTDCGRCVAVCPYSHPDNFIHNMVRWMLKRNPLNRKLALLLDDFFYGRKPKSMRLKKWMKA